MLRLLLSPGLGIGHGKERDRLVQPGFQISCLLQSLDRAVVLFVQEQRQTDNEETDAGGLGSSRRAVSAASTASLGSPA